MVSIKCPYCHTSSSMSSLFLLPTFQLDGKVEFLFRGEEYSPEELVEESKVWTSENEIELRGSLNDLWKCDTCDRVIHVVVSRDDPNARFSIIDEDGNFHYRSVFHVKTIESINPDTWDLSIPRPIRKDLAQAQTAFSAGMVTASALLVRRALERTTADLKVVGNNLAEKIRNLLKNESRLRELADNIRLFGNIAAHAGELDEEPTKEDIEDILAFSKHFMDSIYVMPAKIQTLEGRRSKNEKTSFKQIGK